MTREDRPVDEGMHAAAAAVVAVTVAAACAAAAPALSAPVWLTLVAVVLAPSAVLTALAAVQAGAQRRRVRRPSGHGRPGAEAGAGVSARLLDAQSAVDRCDAAMAAHLHAPPADDDLPVDLAMAGYEARLRLARVMLAEQGTLPRELQDDLIVRFRGFEQLLRRADVR